MRHSALPFSVQMCWRAREWMVLARDRVGVAGWLGSDERGEMRLFLGHDIRCPLA